MCISRFMLFCIVFLGALSTALGGEAKVWTQTSQSDFASGKLNGVSVTSRGDLTLSRSSAAIKGFEQKFVWALTLSPRGVVYAATGSPAGAFRIDAGKATLVTQTSEQHGSSIVVDKNDNVYLGTAPRGMIYKITPAGQVSVLADLPDNYIWGLAIDPKGDLIAATGPDGNLYSINPANGQHKVLFHSRLSNLMSLLVAPDGTMFVGTQPEGLVYRITPQGKAFVILDTDEDEVHTLAFGPRGSVLAGTASKAMPSRAGTPSPVPPQQAAAQHAQPAPGNQPGQQRPMPQQGGAAPGGTRTGVYEIKPNGDIDRILALRDAYVYSLAVSGTDVYVGTGTKGRIYQLGRDHEYTLLADRVEQQILAMVAGKNGRLVFGTGAPGHVVIMEDKLLAKAEFESEVNDVGYLARWGRLYWTADTPAQTQLQLFVRAGNTKMPDNTWTPWTGPFADAAGQNVKLPFSQFVQYKVVFETKDTAASPVLHDISVAYAVRNRPPVIAHFGMDGQDVVAARTSRSSNGKAVRQRPAAQGQQPPGRPGGAPGAPSVKRVTWTAADPDGDTLVYRLEYKGTDEKRWMPLKKRLVNLNLYAWDTNKVPDGYYQLRLTASDELANPADEVMKDVQVNEPFLIDNRRPTLKDLKVAGKPDGKTVTVEGLAEDDVSPIASVRVSIDSGDWTPVFAQDGIFDSPQEKFQFKTPELTPEEHVLIFVTEDAAGNVGSGKLIIQTAQIKAPK